MLHMEFNKQLGEFRLAVNIRASSNDVIALFGRSGCGKSTTINLIAGLLPPDSGRVQLGEQVLFDSRQGLYVPTERRRIGYVFQDARLFPHYTVAGNLHYGLKRSTGSQHIQMDAVVELLGLAALLARRPQQLSGGEKQRVALGRALLSQPQLLLLDEPLASLDQMRRAEVLPYLERVRDQLRMPMVYVSHQFEEVLQLASHVVLMENGQMLAQGNLPAISHEPALRHMIGPEAMGTVIDTTIHGIDPAQGLAHVTVGTGQLNIDAATLRTGQRVRLQLLARDLILSLHPPTGLSVRNALHGHVTRLQDDAHAVLADIDVGGVTLVSRITRAAARELALHDRMPIWVLVKAITLRGHIFRAGNPFHE